LSGDLRTSITLSSRPNRSSQSDDLWSGGTLRWLAQLLLLRIGDKGRVAIEVGWTPQKEAAGELIQQ
jgi:hypothetical protein